MLTRTARPLRARSFAAFCTAALAAAALAVLPALPAAAEDVDPVVAAAEARAAADAAHATAETAAAAATAAAEAAELARTAANDAETASAAAQAAAAAEPLNLELTAAAAAAAAAAFAADALADTAEAASTTAADAAAAAASEAAALEEVAKAAEAALQTDPAPPAEEVEEAPEAEADALSLKQNDNCDISLMTEKNADSFRFCWPEPEIDIDVDNVCPTVITVHLSHLWGWQWWDYTVTVNGVEVAVELDEAGNGSFEVTDFESGLFEVKVYKGDWKVAYEKDWIKSHCPVIETEVEHECNVIDGKGEVEVRISDLIKWRTYDITITGPDGFEESFETDWQEDWEYDFWLYPGEYTVTVESDGWERLPDLGPVVYSFTVDPCPGEVTITLTPTCATNNSGSLGAVLSGLIPGREYWVTVEGPNGFVTDVTFEATESTWAVPPAHLPPGTYTVTVVDTQSIDWDFPDMTLETSLVYIPEYDPLTWTHTGTITACPALASTGTGPSAQLAPALALIPLGAGLVLAGALRNRRQPLMEEES